MRQGLNPLYLKNRGMLLFIYHWDINNKTGTIDLKDVLPMLYQRKRIKQAPTLSSREMQSFKSTKTLSTKTNSTKYFTPLDLLKGMTKKGKTWSCVTNQQESNPRLNRVVCPCSTIFDTTFNQNYV